MIPDTKDSSAKPDAVNSLPKETYSRLYFRFVLLTLLCSVVPLILVGWGIYTYIASLVFLALSTLTILVVSLITTGHMIKVI